MIEKEQKDKFSIFMKEIQNRKEIKEKNEEFVKQFQFMVSRLKKISAQNKYIREQTIKISKMSYILTLDLAHLYKTFENEREIYNSVNEKANEYKNKVKQFEK